MTAIPERSSGEWRETKSKDSSDISLQGTVEDLLFQAQHRLIDKPAKYNKFNLTGRINAKHDVTLYVI